MHKNSLIEILGTPKIGFADLTMFAYVYTQKLQGICYSVKAREKFKLLQERQ